MSATSDSTTPQTGRTRDRGQSMAEYAVLAGFIVVGVLALIVMVSGSIQTTISGVATRI